MKDKIFEFFKSKGYIFIALICLAAVIAAGVSIINLSNEEADEPVAAYRTPSGRPLRCFDVHEKSERLESAVHNCFEANRRQ